LSSRGLGLLPWELLKNRARARNRASNGHRRLEGSRFVALQLYRLAAGGSRERLERVASLGRCDRPCSLESTRTINAPQLNPL